MKDNGLKESDMKDINIPLTKVAEMLHKERQMEQKPLINQFHLVYNFGRHDTKRSKYVTFPTPLGS